MRSLAGSSATSPCRLARILLDRIEDSTTGRVLLDSAHTDIPTHRRAEASATADLLGGIGEDFGLVGGLRLMETDPAAGPLARTWRPALAVVGADGLPPTNSAGNVLRPFTALKLSLRLPPAGARGGPCGWARTRWSSWPVRPCASGTVAGPRVG